MEFQKKQIPTIDSRARLDQAIRHGNSEEAERIVNELCAQENLPETVECPAGFADQIARTADEKRSKIMHKTIWKKCMVTAACLGAVLVTGITANALTGGQLLDSLTTIIFVDENGDTGQANLTKSYTDEKGNSHHIYESEDGKTILEGEIEADANATISSAAIDDYNGVPTIKEATDADLKKEIENGNLVAVTKNADGTYQKADGTKVSAEDVLTIDGKEYCPSVIDHIIASEHITESEHNQ